MEYTIEWDGESKKNLNSLDNSVRQQVMRFINKLEKTSNPKAFGEALTGNLAGYWKYRVGDYRIVADIQDNKLVILVIAIDHRRKIYKKLNKRLNR